MEHETHPAFANTPMENYQMESQQPIASELSLDDRLEQMTDTQQNKFDIPMPADTLPDRGDKGAYKGTIANLKALFKHYGIACHYNVTSKNQVLSMNNDSAAHDLEDSANHAVLRSLLALNNMPMSSIDLLPQLMREKSVNPILEFIEKQPYKPNSVDYFRIVADSLEVEEQDKEYSDLALKTWLIQCVAAADSARRAMCKGEAKFELVLVLQGLQGLGKTTWFKSLLPVSLVEYIASGEHLDPDDTNSLRRCLATWICELGELDATFRKADMERLKAFLSQSVDKIRLPYDRGISNYARRTSFCASVNPENFLIDRTGNRRFLPLAIKHIKRLPSDDNFLQQFWSQIWHEYTHTPKAIWWATKELEDMLEERHQKHAEISPISEMLLDKFDLSNASAPPSAETLNRKHYTCTSALKACGIDKPSRSQISETKSFIEKKGFIWCKTNGNSGFWLAQKGDY